jgi:CDP-glycerol glycerophosphotransferase
VRVRDLVQRRASARQPVLSVVVPLYQVEEYVAECLDSLLATTYRPLEVVVVDDGSTDRSAAIATAYAPRFEQCRMLTQPNAGLGAARNTGIRAATGDYLAFLDSDDTVPPEAYAAMVEVLAETGSDFVTGSVLRLEGGQLSEPGWMRHLHRARRLGIAIDDHPEVIGDVFAWNKVYRRSFWDDAGLAFPEGLRYEDQPTLTEAFLRARAFDVLVRPVYHWRIREDGSSITQRRHEPADLRDRVATKEMSSRSVESWASPAVRDVWYRTVMPGDMPLYLWELLGCDDEYWATLRDGVRTLWPDDIPLWLSTLRTHMRLTAWLVAQDRRSDAETVLRYVEGQSRRLTTEVRAGGRVVAVLPFLDEPDTGIPANLYEVADHEPERARALESGPVQPE